MSKIHKPDTPIEPPVERIRYNGMKETVEIVELVRRRTIREITDVIEAILDVKMQIQPKKITPEERTILEAMHRLSKRK